MVASELVMQDGRRYWWWREDGHHRQKDREPGYGTKQVIFREPPETGLGLSQLEVARAGTAPLPTVLQAKTFQQQVESRLHLLGVHQQL